MFRFKRSNAGALPEPFSVGEVVILSSATELALSQVILILLTDPDSNLDKMWIPRWIRIFYIQIKMCSNFSQFFLNKSRDT